MSATDAASSDLIALLAAKDGGGSVVGDHFEGVGLLRVPRET